MTDGQVPLGTPDTAALRRRVLLVALISVALYLALSYLVFWLEVSDAWLLVGMVLLYLLVIRPMMRPVREALKLRRRLAYAAWLEDRDRREQ